MCSGADARPNPVPLPAAGWPLLPPTVTSPLVKLLGAAVLLAVTFGVAGLAQPPDPKKPTDTRSAPSDPPVVKLPDGTFLWLGAIPDGNGERVTLTPQEFQKLLDQLDQLKKQLAARKAMPPSRCAISGEVKKRGEQPVAVLTLTYSFRTTLPQTAVLLGGRKGFLVKATFADGKLPVIETTEDGFAVLVEQPGDYTLTLELEAPVTTRGSRPELGFEIGLPRAAITTLLFAPPAPEVERVNLITRTPDPSQPLRPAEPRRVAALEVSQLAARPDHEAGYPLGPVDSLELTWDSSISQPTDRVQSAELNIAVVLSEELVETTGRIVLRGPSREWHLLAPPGAEVNVDRVAGAADGGASLPPAVSKPADPAKPVWKIEFPKGVAASDYVVTVLARQRRPVPDDPKHRGPFPVGPLAVLDVLRQTGTVRVTTVAHTRFIFKHGPELRRDVSPGPPEDGVTTAFFRLTTGPTGGTPPNAPLPLLTVEAVPLAGTIRVKPVYRLTFTETGWRVRAEVRVSPFQTAVEAVAVDVPAEWRGLEASPAELVEGIQPGTPGGFWATAPARLAGGERIPVAVRLATPQKQPFDLVLTATVPFPSGASEATISFPRFPGAVEQEATLTATVSDGLEVRGEARGWDGDVPAGWTTPLAPVVGPAGKPAKAVTAVTGKTSTGLARAVLGWSLPRADLAAELRADVTIEDRQVVVRQVIKLRSADGFPHKVRFRGPGAAGLKADPPLEPLGPGEWAIGPLADLKEVTLTLSFAVHTGRSADDRSPWKVPITLVWPVGPTRVESTVRVWSYTVVPRAVTNLSPGWRELPVEPVPERDALPALVLSATGGEVPLTLESRESAAPGAVGVWVDRAWIQAWTTDADAISYRARFRLRRWLVPAVEVQLPVGLVGMIPEFFRDDEKLADAVPLSESGAFRVPLPEPRPGRTTIIEVRYRLPANRLAAGATEYLPPRLPAAGFLGPVRWQVMLGSGSVPLLVGGATAELQWFGRGGRLLVGATGTDELERWLRGDDTGGVAAVTADDDSLTAYQPTPAPLDVLPVPRVGFVVVCSVAVFLVILVVSRLRVSVLGPAVVLIGLALALVGIVFPQPAARALEASQLGVVSAVVVLLAQVALSWYYRHRVARLPGFTRSGVKPTTASPLPSSARNRAPAVGGSGATPAPAAGG